MQTEHDYISRKEIYEFLDRVKEVADIHSDEIIKGVIWGTVDAIRQLVGLAKEQDVVPVRHGRWKPFDLTYGRSVYCCTACWQAENVPTAMGVPMFTYCPNCGAIMDGKDGSKGV